MQSRARLRVQFNGVLLGQQELTLNEAGRAITPLRYHSFSLTPLRPLYTRVNTLSDFRSLGGSVWQVRV
jgi:hypothetical protein